MKKRNATKLSEILYQDINQVGNYVEDFQKLLFDKVLGIEPGVIFGLTVGIAVGGQGVDVTPGAIVDRTFAYGELEVEQSVELDSLPESGTRYDIVSARYMEIADTPGQSYVLVDVDLRTQTLETVYRRRFGSIILEIYEDATVEDLTAGRLPLARLEVTSEGIQNVESLHDYIKVSNVNLDDVLAGLEADIENIVLNTQLIGDVVGTIAENTVTHIQGRSVASDAPSSGQALVWDGSEWKPTTISIPDVTLGGDLDGTLGDAEVVGIDGLPILNSPTEAGQVLKVNDEQDGLEWGAAEAHQILEWTNSGTTIVDGVFTYSIPPSAAGASTLIPGDGMVFYDKSEYSFNLDKTEITFSDLPIEGSKLEFFYSSLSPTADDLAEYVKQEDLDNPVTGYVKKADLPTLVPKISVAILQDQKPSGSTDGKALVKDQWVVADINTIVSDSDNIVTIDENSFKLNSGIYIIEWFCPVHGAGRSRSALFNKDTSDMVSVGGGSYDVNDLLLYGNHMVEVVTEVNFELKVYLVDAGSVPVIGRATSVPGVNEVYTQVKIMKIG